MSNEIANPFNLSKVIQDRLADFEERWQERKYEGMREAVTDVLENLFDLVDLCNSLLAERRSRLAPAAEAQERLFKP